MSQYRECQVQYVRQGDVVFFGEESKSFRPEIVQSAVFDGTTMHVTTLGSVEAAPLGAVAPVTHMYHLLPDARCHLYGQSLFQVMFSAADPGFSLPRYTAVELAEMGLDHQSQQDLAKCPVGQHIAARFEDGTRAKVRHIV